MKAHSFGRRCESSAAQARRGTQWFCTKYAHTGSAIYVKERCQKRHRFSFRRLPSGAVDPSARLSRPAPFLGKVAYGRPLIRPQQQEWIRAPITDYQTRLSAIRAHLTARFSSGWGHNSPSRRSDWRGSFPQKPDGIVAVTWQAMHPVPEAYSFAAPARLTAPPHP